MMYDFERQTIARPEKPIDTQKAGDEKKNESFLSRQFCKTDSPIGDIVSLWW